MSRVMKSQDLVGEHRGLRSQHERDVVARLMQIGTELNFPKLTASQTASLLREQAALMRKLPANDAPTGEC